MINSNWTFASGSTSDSNLRREYLTDAIALYTPNSGSGGILLAYYKTPIQATREHSVKFTISGTTSSGSLYVAFGLATNNPSGSLGRTAASYTNFNYSTYGLTGIDGTTSSIGLTNTIADGYTISYTPKATASAYVVLYAGTNAKTSKNFISTL